jgi:hypothetical protein
MPPIPTRVSFAVEGEGARAGRAADDDARLDDAEADVAAVGVCGGAEDGAGQGRQRDQAGTKDG